MSKRLEQLKKHIESAQDGMEVISILDSARGNPTMAGVTKVLDGLLSSVMVLQELHSPDVLKPKLGEKCEECDEGVLELRTLQPYSGRIANSLFCPVCKMNHPLPQLKPTRTNSIPHPERPNVQHLNLGSMKDTREVRFELLAKYDATGVEELLKDSGMQNHQWLLREIQAAFVNMKLPDLIRRLNIEVPDEAFDGRPVNNFRWTVVCCDSKKKFATVNDVWLAAHRELKHWSDEVEIRDEAGLDVWNFDNTDDLHEWAQSYGAICFHGPLHECDNVCSGWFVNVETREVERCDICQRFDSDSAVVEHVMSCTQQLERSEKRKEKKLLKHLEFLYSLAKGVVPDYNVNAYEERMLEVESLLRESKI